MLLWQRWGQTHTGPGKMMKPVRVGVRAGIVTTRVFCVCILPKVHWRFYTLYQMPQPAKACWDPFYRNPGLCFVPPWCLPGVLRLNGGTSDPLSPTRKHDLDIYFVVLLGTRCSLSSQTKNRPFTSLCSHFFWFFFRVGAWRGLKRALQNYKTIPAFPARAVKRPWC